MLLGCFPSHSGTHPLGVQYQEAQNQDASDSDPSCAVAFEASSDSVNLAMPRNIIIVKFNVTVAVIYQGAQRIQIYSNLVPFM
jgi:hypothetical protein